MHVYFIYALVCAFGDLTRYISFCHSLPLVFEAVLSLNLKLISSDRLVSSQTASPPYQREEPPNLTFYVGSGVLNSGSCICAAGTLMPGLFLHSWEIKNVKKFIKENILLDDWHWNVIKTETWTDLTHSSMFLQPAYPRWMKCVEQTGSFFQPTLAALFVREAFGPSIRSAVCESLPQPATPYPFQPARFALAL